MATPRQQQVRRCMATLVLVLCLAPTEVVAAPDPPSTLARLEALVRSGKLDEAISQAETALPTATDAKVGALLAEACQKKAAAMAEKAKPPADLLAMVDRGLRGQRTVKLLKFRGRILTALQRPAEAYEAYEDALDRSPDGKDQTDIASEMTAVYKGLAERMCRASVTASLADAELRVGVAGEPRKLPARMWLPRGNHVVQVGPPGGPMQTRQIECAAAPVALHVDMPRLAVDSRTQAPQLLQVPPEPTPLSTHLEPPPSRSALHKYGPWATAALGVVGVGLGGYWQHDYNAQATAGTVPAESEKAMSLAGYVGGGALLAGSLVWWWLAPDGR